MSGKFNTGGTAFPMQDPQAIHTYASGRIADIPRDQVDERDRAYLAARAEAIGGMTLRQYAAIHLRVPNSGTDWLDAMIVEAKRDELAAKAMQSYLLDKDRDSFTFEQWANAAYEMADAMLKAGGSNDPAP